MVKNDLHIRYANFVYLKTLYSNSCIYDYTIKKLADKAKKSRTFIRSNVNFFLKAGWCRMHGKNLIFNTNEHLSNLYGIKFKHYCTLRFQNIEQLKLEMYNKLLLNKKRQVDYIIKLKHDLFNPRTLKALKRAKRYFFGENVAIDEKFTISYMALAELFNSSKSYAFNIVSKLIKADYMRKQRNITLVLRNVTNEFFKSLLLGSNYFIFRGSLYKSDSNNYTMLG